MSDESRDRTSATLLLRLRTNPQDDAAWDQFVDRYRPMIFSWCRGFCLQDADAEDVTQAVLLKLYKHVGSFQYDPAQSFRHWLKTLTHHAWHDFITNPRRADAGTGDSKIMHVLGEVTAREDLIARMESAFDQELLDFAMARVQGRLEPKTWQAFQMMALEGRSGAEAAAALDMKIANVFAYRSKVQKLLQQEVRLLEAEQEAISRPPGA